MSENVFETLHNIDVSEKIKEKNGLKYLSWASAWAEVKKVYPGATYKVYPQIDNNGNTRFWHDDGKTGWVEVGVTIEGVEHISTLAIMDFKNKSIPADQITSVDANKSMQRCFTKACAMHGLGLFIYQGEDMPENVSKVIDLQEEITELAKKKSALSEKAKSKAIDLCKAAEKEANPDLDDELITGKIANIEDADILEKLKKQLLAVRK
jgi:hypothetical protein